MVMSTQRAGPLQALVVDAITAVAGRINLSDKSKKTEVIFETSLDQQRAEMSFV